MNPYFIHSGLWKWLNIDIVSNGLSFSFTLDKQISDFIYQNKGKSVAKYLKIYVHDICFHYICSYNSSLYYKIKL